MTKKQATNFVDELKKAFPKYDISTRETKQRSKLKLILFQGFTTVQGLDDWALDVINNFWWKKIVKLFDKHKGATQQFRILFIKENQFVLYSNYEYLGGKLCEARIPISNLDQNGLEENMYWMGECKDINDLLTFLTTTKEHF